jgi:hypothetical protein
MNTYNPDVWVIIELSGSKVKNRYHRILAGWYGGFADADTWRMSSGITKIIDGTTYWEIRNDSGSAYYCSKQFEKTSMLTESMYEYYSKQNTEELKITMVPFKSIKDLYA